MPKRKSEEPIEVTFNEEAEWQTEEVPSLTIPEGTDVVVTPHKWEGMYLHGEYRGRHFAWYHVVNGKLAPVASSWDLPSNRRVVYPRAAELSEMELA